MNHEQLASYAVACLEGLDHPQTVNELARSQHVPLEDCIAVLQRLEAAGLVHENPQGLIEPSRALERITAYEVLQAVWAKPVRQKLHILYETRNNVAEHVTRRVLGFAAALEG